MKILQASNLQVGLLEGCQRILEGDVAGLMLGLNKGQSGCLRGSSKPPKPSVNRKRGQS